MGGMFGGLGTGFGGGLMRPGGGSLGSLLGGVALGATAPVGGRTFLGMDNGAWQRLMNARATERQLGSQFMGNYVDQATHPPNVGATGIWQSPWNAGTAAIDAAYQPHVAGSKPSWMGNMPYDTWKPLARALWYKQQVYPTGYGLGSILGGLQRHYPQGLPQDQTLGTPITEGGGTGDGTTKPGGGVIDTGAKAYAPPVSGEGGVDTGVGNGPAITGTAPSGPGSVGSGFNAYTGQYGYSRNYTWEEGKRLAGEGPMPSTFAPKQTGPVRSALAGLLQNMGMQNGFLGRLLGGGTVQLPTQDLGYIQDYYLGPRRLTFAAAHGLT